MKTTPFCGVNTTIETRTTIRPTIRTSKDSYTHKNQPMRISRKNPQVLHFHLFTHNRFQTGPSRTKLRKALFDSCQNPFHISRSPNLGLFFALHLQGLHSILFKPFLQFGPFCCWEKQTIKTDKKTLCRGDQQ
jgi:hypothetical protein